MRPLILPTQLAVGDLIHYENQRLQEKDGLSTRYTFAGGHYFARMQETGLYTTDREAIFRRVKKCGLEGIYSEPLF